MEKRILKRERSAWSVMIKRCENPRHKDFPRYGAKGIKVCREWMESFEQFLADMGTAPTQTHWLGRRDVTAGYFPGNCCWTTQPEQERRRAYCRRVVIDFMTMTAAEAERLPGQPTRNSVLRRAARGFPLNVSAARIDRRSTWLTFNDETLPLPEMAKRFGVPRELLWKRLKVGWPLDRALNPLRSKGRSQKINACLRHLAGGADEPTPLPRKE